MFHWVPFDVYTINTGLGASLFLFPPPAVTRKPVGSLMFKSIGLVLCLSVLLAAVSSAGRGGSSSGADPGPLGGGQACLFMTAPPVFLGLKWSF